MISQNFNQFLLEDPEVKQLLVFYKNFSKYFFSTIGSILAIIFSFFIVFSTDFGKNGLMNFAGNKDISFLNKKNNVLKSNLSRYGNKKIYSGFILKGLVKGFVEISGSILKVQNGFVKYRDFLLFPNSFEIRDVKRFVNLTNNTGNIKRFLIFYYKFITPLNEISLPKSKHLKVVKNFVKFFGLDCVDSFKITDFFCKKQIENFYKESLDYKIFDTDSFIFDNLFVFDKQSFCNYLKEYVFYNNIINDVIIKYAYKCGGDVNESITFLKNMNSVINDINSNVISAKLFNNKQFDIFKLLSYQNLLRKRLKHILANYYLFDNYLNFVISFVNQYHADKFLMDLVYFYNNYLLKNRILKAESKGVGSSKIQNLLTKIGYINGGNLNVLYALNDLIDKDLFIIGSKKKFSNIEFHIESMGEKFEKFIQRNYPDFLILSKKRNRLGMLEVRFSAVFKRKLLGGVIIKKSLSGEILVSLKGNIFYVSDIVSLNDSFVETYIKNLLKLEGSMSFSDFYNKISDIIFLKHSTASKKNLCDLLTNRINKFSNGFSISKCIEKNGQVELLMEKGYNKEKIIYHMIIEKVGFKYKLSYEGQGIAKNIKGTFIGSNIDEISKFIQFLLKKEFNNKLKMPLVLRSILEDKFKKFLNVNNLKYVNYNPKNKIAGILFNVGGVNLYGFVVIPKNYKLVIISIVLIKNKKIIQFKLSKPVQLEMVEKNAIKFNQFKLDPINFLKQYDPKAVERYLNALKNR